MRRSVFASSIRFAPLIAMLLVAVCADDAEAQGRSPHRLHGEAGVSMSLRRDDARDGAGPHLGVGYEYLVRPFLGMEARYDFVLFPYDREMWAGSGRATYHAFGAGVRAHLLPHPGRFDPSVGATASLVLTGSLVRAGLAADVSLDVLVGRGLSLGPVLRYAHVLQPNDGNVGARDGRILSLSLGLTWGRPRVGVCGTTFIDDVDSSLDALPSETPPDDAIDDTAAERSGVEAPPRDAVADPAAEDSSAYETARSAPTATPAAIVAALPRVQFELGSSELTASETSKMRRILEALSDPRIERVRVVGHADEVGDVDYNLRLSEQRARTLVRWLVQNGIDEARLEAAGVGSSEPVLAGRSARARRANRRAELRLVESP